MWDEGFGDQEKFALLRVWVGRMEMMWGVPKIVPAFENWARNVVHVVIGTLAGSPYSRFFGCKWCFHGMGKREKTRGKPRTSGMIKNVVIRVFPSVDKVREQSQIGRYLASPQIAEDEDGYRYSITAFCSECKINVCGRRRGYVEKPDFSRCHGGIGMGRGPYRRPASDETRAALEEWVDRRGDRWGYM